MNIEKYIGIPFKYGQQDCFTLLKDIEGEFGNSIPTIRYNKNNEKRVLNDFLKTWTGWHKINRLRKGVIIIFNILNKNIHLGVGLSDSRFIHMTEKSGCVISRYSDNWKKRTLFIWEKK